MEWTYPIILKPCVSWLVIIIICIIDTAWSQLIPQEDGILRQFRVYRELSIDLSVYEHRSTTLNTSENGQAECANFCINEISFTCRAFTFRRDQNISLNAECVWSAGSPNTDGRLAFLVDDSSVETYVRLENECDPLLVDKLPAMCPTPLGMKRGLLSVFRGQIVPIEIGDGQITASSWAFEPNSPQFARYDGTSCWKKNVRDLNPWIQVDFNERHIVTGLVLQGCGMEFHGWIQKFRVESRTSGNPFVIHKNHKTVSEELVGNVEPRCGKLVTLNPVIYADSLRLVPLTWYRSPGLRFEILGCKNGCDFSLGLTDNSIKDEAIVASSTLDSNIPPNNVRIQPLGIQVSPTLGWRPTTRNNEWIQVRFLEVMLVKSIITQGCSSVQSYPRNFIIEYSIETEDVENMQTVNYPSSNDALRFPANVDTTSLLRHDIPQVVKARIVRVTPTDWAGGIQCMKMELIGCVAKECGDQMNIANTPGAIQVQGSLTCSPTSFAIFGNSSSNPRQTVLPFPAIIKVPLLINLGSEYTVTGIVIQGSINEPQYGPTWATKFTLQYAMESVDESSHSFRNYLNIDGSVKIFQANFDSVTPVTIYLDRPIVATKLYLIYYNDDVIYPRVPCIRVDFLGCLLADNGYLCGLSGAEAAGFCFTTVASRNDEACPSIFHSASYPAIIKSSSVDTALNSVLPQIKQSGYEYYRMGLTHQNVRNSTASNFQWVDGTPLQYQLFESSTIANNDDELCPAIYLPDTEHWQALTCESSSQAVGTICQFDLDECRQGNSGCARDCINYPGGYACECPPRTFLNWWDRKGCETLCGLLHLTSLKDDFPDKCFELHVDEPTAFSEASQICSRREGTFVELWHLDSLARNWQGPGPFPVDRVWIPDVPTIRGNEGLLLCKIGGVTMNPNSPPRIWWSRYPCTYSLPFICVQDVPPTVILQPSREISVVNTTETAAYMRWLGLPPWFDQLSQSHVNIRVESGLSIRFRIALLNVRELDSDNCLDELKITEHLPTGKVFQHPSLCGQLSNFEVQTRTNVVNLVLKIGQLIMLESLRHLSLRLLYEAVDCNVVECETICPSRDTIIDKPWGLIRTFTDQPYILPPAYNCQWTIVLSPDKFVRLNFVQMWIEPKHPINVYLRAINQSQIDETQYVSVTSPIWLYSETNKVIVSYDTGIIHQSSGFVARFGQSAGPFEASGCGVIPREVHGTCPDTNCNQPRAFFGSPNYPQKYPNLVCKWTITTSPGTYVWVHVFAFDSAGDYKCQEVYIETVDLDRWSRICGNSAKTSYPTSSRRNEFKLTFHSGNPNRYGNFHAVYEERYFETPTYDEITERDKDFSCPAGWNLFGGRCFLVVKNNKTLRWNEAHIHCLERAENNSDLASIRNQAEMNFVHELLVKGEFESEKFYIGLTVDLKTRRYVWTDGLPLCYSDWYFPGNPYITDQREPNGGDTEACSMIELKQYDSTKNWLDIPCADPLTSLFICAKPAHYYLQDVEGHELAQPILTFHTESCDSGYFRIADKCLHMVFVEILKKKITSANVSEVCGNGSNLIGESFVMEHFDQVKSYQKFIWQLYGHVIIDNPPTTNADELPCIIPYESEIVTCDSSQIQFALCVKDAINLTQHCKQNQFKCESGECVNVLFVNDLREDCADGSDEKNVDFQATGSDGRFDCSNPSFMKCDSGDCIHARHFCDFQDDCFDRSDEKYCVYPPCNSSEFQCYNGQCIPLYRLCDLLEDCADGTDEINCVSSEHIFQCYSGQPIPVDLYCDGHRDCSGKVFEDEPDTCDHLQSGFTCNRTHQLTCHNKACSERDNICMMYEDEYGYPEGCRDVTHLRDCAFFECTNFTFKCEESYCIPQHFKCNGRYDCPGKEDEMNCDTFNCTGAYKCHHSTNCVTQHLVCDGIRHCPEGDDEESCGRFDHGCPNGCSCYGVTYTCRNMLWDQSTALRTPRDIKQLHLSFLSSKGRFKRDSDSNSYSIEEVTFIDLSLFPFLLSLDLSGNGINFLGNGTFASNPNLRFLNLSFNEIYELDSWTFTGLLGLQILDLSGNKNLKNAFGSPFLHLNKMRHLYIQDTALVTSAEDFLVGLDSIQTFHSDRFFYCCLLSESETLRECLPTQGDFSSCSDLIRNGLLRIAMWILGTSALCGNLAVIVWRVFRQGILKRRKRNPVQALLVVNLAIADLFMGCYMLFIAIADVHFRGTYALFSDQWQTSFFCRFAGFLSTLSSVSSVMFLTVISFDRYLNVVFPFSRRHMKLKSALVVACGIWMIVTLIGVLPALIYGGAYYGRSSVCLALPITAQRLDGWYFSFFVFIVLTLVLFLIIVFCYISIFIVARRSSKASRNAVISNTQQKEEQLQMALKVAFLVGTDFVCWVPIIFMGFLSFTSSAVSGGVYAWTAVFVLPINSSLNPYLYTFLVERASRASREKAIASTLSTRTTTEELPQAYPLVQQTTTNQSQKETITGESDLLKAALVSLRATRLMPPLLSDKYKKLMLSSLMTSGDFTVTETDKEDILMDLTKALDYLHGLGVVHGDVSENFVVIDESSYGNKRAFLLKNFDLTHQETVAEGGSKNDASMQQDQAQLRDLKARLNNIAVKSSDKI
ncbi:hypothetical protein HOLleu_31517 [Holothuria leucospilota]|uniref:Uncharacterized protein n=1 Tax=Holothuria leucospilota TaxID=206669 RepID=A0A9Q1BIE5_HOLLE|nr:hypothetical protein HOLleu_31517 [Holothuria leucospilota]